MPQTFNLESNNNPVISYLTLRKAIGILGMGLPTVILPLFYFTNKTGEFPPSISHYYYTSLGTLFTGVLCAVALFMFAYNGPEGKDKVPAMIVCVCALGVAFCPANPYLAADINICPRVNLDVNNIRNGFHYGFAMIFFSTLAYFCFKLFTKTGDGAITRKKLVRNKIYRWCGAIIIFCIACIGLLSIPAIDRIPFVRSINQKIFILETIALYAFGISWLVKGEIVLKDK